ncbi:uncharacterized protein YxjI [Paenibacillus amylolyticus]|uniref:Uncharacterized protein YxjI n=1 Tax=Paenibacillus amylolyticus TaxID=1451 RepID=A0AAP5H643_PAEAM|nr:hypothetical protein [Paenibacillus amylolyticus]MDR6727058.1 uncharacterized protein YxjI [Paenibacillus amylolyticus]
MELYFKDNFFNAGYTEIMNQDQEQVGHLDLKSAFGSSIDVFAPSGLICSGKFRMLTNRWDVTSADGSHWGVLRARLSFFSKKYEYDAGSRGVYEVSAPAFSQEYEITGMGGRTVASFRRTSGWFSSGAFVLHNESEQLGTYELIAVVMGVHAINKRRNSANST